MEIVNTLKNKSNHTGNTSLGMKKRYVPKRLSVEGTTSNKKEPTKIKRKL